MAQTKNKNLIVKKNKNQTQNFQLKKKLTEMKKQKTV